MHRFSRAARRAAVVTVALASVVACVAFTWYALKPGVIGRLGEMHLLALLGLYIAPPAAFFAWRWERAHRADPVSIVHDQGARQETDSQESGSEVRRDVRWMHPAHREQSEIAARQHHRRQSGTPQA